MSIVQVQPWCHLAHATAIMRLEDFSVFGLSYMLPQCLGNGKVREAKKPMKSKTRYLRYFAFLKGLVVSSSRLL